MYLAHVVLTAIFCISCCLAEYDDVCDEVCDDLELIKCELRELRSSNEELKRSNEEIRKENEVQNGEIKKLKAIATQQKISLGEVKIHSSKLSTFCRLLPKDICGNCYCLDDYTLVKKYYCDCQHLAPMRDCVEFLKSGNHISGVYRVTLNNLKMSVVYCDQESQNGGWTVIQRRFDGKTKFYRNWSAYKSGFGSVHREFWFGNDLLYLLTLQAVYPDGSELLIEMSDWEGKSIHAKYSSVNFENEERNYTLHVGGYSGTGGDSLHPHNRMAFSTYDRDNDKYPSGACARNHRGAWWYGSCHASNLNGEYRWYDDKQPGFARGVIWYSYKGHEYSLKSVEMKVRRKG